MTTYFFLSLSNFFLTIFPTIFRLCISFHELGPPVVTFTSLSIPVPVPRVFFVTYQLVYPVLVKNSLYLL